MSRRDRLVYDIATENKLRKADVAARRKAEDESLGLHVRDHALFEQCSGDMLRFRMLLDVLRDRGLVNDAILAEADAHARRHAAAHPVTTPMPKVEPLRVELWREPDPALAALLERDGFACVSGPQYAPSVYYGSGVLIEYKGRIASPDTVAVCAAAGAGVRGRRLGPDTSGAKKTSTAPAGMSSPRPSPPERAREACPPSALLRQFGGLHERRMAGSS